MKYNEVDPRLLSASAFVRQGAVLADIGTDHGYLPIFLLKCGRVSRAVLTDVNEGPLRSAESNLRRAGLSHLAETVLTDGAAGLEGKGITDVAVCGMGGELIASIIEASPWLKRGDIRLILQPMSRQERLVEYLSDAGFAIRERSYSESGGKFYTCLLAEYTATPYVLSALEKVAGQGCPDSSQLRAYCGYIEGKLNTLDKIRRGRDGEDSRRADELYRSLSLLLEAEGSDIKP